MHAFHKLNDVTIPAQTPIPRKDIVLDTMTGSEIFGAIDLTDGFYQILIRDSNIPFTAVITPSRILWEWLVIPQGLKKAPATFKRMVTQSLRPLQDFAPSYFDDIVVHSRAEQRPAPRNFTFGTCNRCFEGCARINYTQICRGVSSVRPRFQDSVAMSARKVSVLI